jgi:uncharacterized protein (DUF934 family)
MKMELEIIHGGAPAPDESADVLRLDNATDVLALSLDGVQRIDLHFPKFADGRAFSQAFLLRRRLGFQGDIRAVGDVLIDQLVQMQRSGFTQAVLRADQSLAHGQALLSHYPAFYQGDAVQATPHFAAAAVSEAA